MITLPINWTSRSGFSDFATAEERSVISEIIAAWLRGENVSGLAPARADLSMTVEYPEPSQTPADIGPLGLAEEALRVRATLARVTFTRAPQHPYPAIELFVGIVRDILSCEHRDSGVHRVDGTSEAGHQLFDIRCNTCGAIDDTRYAFAPSGQLLEMTDEEFDD